MAIISTLIGGVCGFLAFVTAWLFFDVGFLPALALYAGVGFSLTATLIFAGISWKAAKKLQSARAAVHPCTVQAPAGHNLSKHRN